MEIVSQSEILLVEAYLKYYPEKSTSTLEELAPSEIVDSLNGLASATVASVIKRLNAEKACETLVLLPDEMFTKVYAILDPIRAAHLLSKLKSEKKLQKLKLLSPSEIKDVTELSLYPVDSAGALMDTQVRTCRSSDSVGKVISSFRKDKSDSREIFVININGKLVGYVPLYTLFSSEDKNRIEGIMHKEFPSINALSPKDEVNEAFETYKITTLPVVHIDGSLLGAIRYAKLMQTAQFQAISAMASLGGASPAERTLSPPLFSVGKRLPWLFINLLTAFIASAVVGFFEGTIAKVTSLAVLLPVVAGQSGNTGAQAMAVAMRGLALREFRVRQWMKVLFKELRVGFINGIFIAIVTGLSVYFWSHSGALGLVMTAAMVSSMIIASMAGAGIPIILTALGKDPAQSSSVILTTVTDVMGFISFLGLATLFVSFLAI